MCAGRMVEMRRVEGLAVGGLVEIDEGFAVEANIGGTDGPLVGGVERVIV